MEGNFVIDQQLGNGVPFSLPCSQKNKVIKKLSKKEIVKEEEPFIAHQKKLEEAIA
jgi:hypothetical protein